MKRATVEVLVLILAAAACVSAAEAPPPKSGPVPGKATGPTTYEYQGRQVSAVWFNLQYAYFKDKIAAVDGKFYDVGQAQAWLAAGRPDKVPVVTPTPPAVGEARLSSGPPPENDLRRDAARIGRALGTDTALVVSGSPMVSVHVGGIDPAKCANGAPFWNELLVYTGVHEYINKRGVKHEIQGFVVYKPVTRDEFAQALAGGLALVRYKVAQKKAAAPGGPGEPTLVAEPVAVPGAPASPRPPAAEPPRQG
jgi:hypothetical protein